MCMRWQLAGGGGGIVLARPGLFLLFFLFVSRDMTSGDSLAKREREREWFPERASTDGPPELIGGSATTFCFCFVARTHIDTYIHRLGTSHIYIHAVDGSHARCRNAFPSPPGGGARPEGNKRRCASTRRRILVSPTARLAGRGAQVCRYCTYILYLYVEKHCRSGVWPGLTRQ